MQTWILHDFSSNLWHIGDNFSITVKLQMRCWFFYQKRFTWGWARNYVDAFCSNKGNSNLISLYFQIVIEREKKFDLLKLLIINQPSAVGCPYVKKKIKFLYVSIYTQSYHGMKDSTNAKGIFYSIFQKWHILASADTSYYGTRFCSLTVGIALFAIKFRLKFSIASTVIFQY